MGLGHMRRNLMIAKTLSAPPTQAIVLMVAGSRQLNQFTLPSGCDSLTLPALHKNGAGQYASHCLDVSLKEVISFRRRTIRAAIQAFEPDVLIVDKVPLGLFGELDPTLQYLSRRNGTRCVLGLREILDDKKRARQEWATGRNNEAIRGHYHAVWVYGDPAVYDMVKEYEIPDDVAAKVRYTGYLDRRELLESANRNGRNLLADHGLPPGRLALCTVGGGQDGALVAEAFAKADLPAQFVGLIVTGPFMPAPVRLRLHNLAKNRRNLFVIEFVRELAPLLSYADRIVSMGGYNSICEVLSFGKNALIIPRVKPRLEQMIRAERLARLGILEVLHPDEVTPGALAKWLSLDLPPSRPVRERIDLKGLNRLPTLLE
jgi:predicted glycosyltransferase